MPVPPKGELPDFLKKAAAKMDEERNKGVVRGGMTTPDTSECAACRGNGKKNGCGSCGATK